MNTNSVPSKFMEWPYHFRLTSIARLPGEAAHGIINQATLYHDRVQISVSWHSNSADTRLKHGSIVSIRGLPSSLVIRANEPIPIGRLELQDKPVAAVNLFELVPPQWFCHRPTVERAIQLWNAMERPFQHLLNAVLWEGGRFYRFIVGPESIQDLPCQQGSNFKRAVEIATNALTLTKGLYEQSTSIVVLASLLQQIAKADNFRITGNQFELSERGLRVNSQFTVFEWLAIARTKIIIADKQYLALLNTLIESRHSPEDRHSQEASTLAVATSLAIRPRSSSESSFV